MMTTKLKRWPTCLGHNFDGGLREELAKLK